MVNFNVTHRHVQLVIFHCTIEHTRNQKAFAVPSVAAEIFLLYMNPHYLLALSSYLPQQTSFSCFIMLMTFLFIEGMLELRFTNSPFTVGSGGQLLLVIWMYWPRKLGSRSCLRVSVWVRDEIKWIQH